MILILGLEYSFIAKTALGFTMGYPSSSLPNKLVIINSARNFLHCHQNHTFSHTIKIPLIHLAVQRGILSEVSFLLTNDNVNCKSYQCVFQRDASSLALVNPLRILDTPLKIAIDKFDAKATEILLSSGADPNIVIRPQLTHSDSKSVESFTTLSDYVLTKTPETEEQTKSYIKIANLLYSYLGSEAVSSFRQTCKSKIITVDGQEKNLIEYIECAQQIKSASKVALTEWSDDLLATTASTNDIVQNIFSNFSGGTPSNSMSHIVDTIPVVGDNCFLPIFVI